MVQISFFGCSPIFTKTNMSNKKELSPFESYAIRAARTFKTSLVSHNSPYDTQIPERVDVSSYHYCAAAAEQKALKHIESLKNTNLEELCEQDYVMRMQQWEKNKAENEKLKDEYNKLIAQTTAWAIPKNLESFRDFMLERLKYSVEFECNDTYLTKPSKNNPNAFKRDKINSINQNIKFHNEKYKEELQRAEEDNAWLDSFWKNLNK